MHLLTCVFLYIFVCLCAWKYVIVLLLTTATQPRAGMLSLTADRWLKRLLPRFRSRKLWISWMWSEIGFSRSCSSGCRRRRRRRIRIGQQKDAGEKEEISVWGECKMEELGRVVANGTCKHITFKSNHFFSTTSLTCFRYFSFYNPSVVYVPTHTQPVHGANQ